MATMTKEVASLSLPATPGWKVSSDRQDGKLGEFEAHAFPFIDRLYRTALILTGSPHFAKNLLQDTILRARRSYRRFHNDDDFGRWMFRLLFDAFGLNRHRAGPRPEDAFNPGQKGKLFPDFLTVLSPKTILPQYLFWEMTLSPVCA